MPRLSKINSFAEEDYAYATACCERALAGHVLHRAMARVVSFEAWEKASAELRSQCIALEAQAFADDIDRLVRDKD